MIAAKPLGRVEAPGRLGSADVSALESVDEVGRATSIRLVATFELARRAATQGYPPDALIRGPSEAFKIVGPRLRDRLQEEFHALLLTTRHRVLRAVLVTRGILDAALIHPREVFRLTEGEGAAGVILVFTPPETLRLLPRIGW